MPTRGAASDLSANWFIGIVVDPGRWFERVMADAPAMVRVIHPGDLHMTGAFLGPCGAELAERAWARLEEEPLPSVDVALGALEAFGNVRRGAALAAVLTDGREEAVRLMSSVRDLGLEAAGLPPSSRAMRPHVTLARVKRRARDGERRVALSWAETIPPIQAQLQLVSLALYTRADAAAPQSYRMVRERTIGDTSD